jgi:hypothetical protein
LFFKIAQGSKGYPSSDYPDNNQSPVRPERVSPYWQRAFWRLLLGLILFCWGGWSRIYRIHSWVLFSFATFLLGGCLLFGPRLS